MNLPRAMTLLVVVSLLLQPIFPMMVLSGLRPSRPVEATASVDAQVFAEEDLSSVTNTTAPSGSSATALNDRPYLPVIYKIGVVESGLTSATQINAFPGTPPTPHRGVGQGVPRVSATQPITNGEDIMYLVNSKQIARTQNFPPAVLRGRP